MSPATLAAGLMLVSAMTHALIGAIMKRSHDKLIFRAVLAGISGLIALPFLFYFPLPSLAVFKVLALSALIHWIYHLAQAAAYTRGDMSVVYPIMRGTAPALAGFFAFLFLSESLRPVEMVGLGIVVLSIIGFGLPGKSQDVNWKPAIGFALFCGVLTAIYTVVDAYGMRISDIRFSYIAWFFALEAVGILLIVGCIKRGELISQSRLDFKGGALSGALAILSYGSALFALSLAPIAKLAAIRETSVIFAALLATLWLKENFGMRRVLLALALALGLILMHIAGHD